MIRKLYFGTIKNSEFVPKRAAEWVSALTLLNGKDVQVTIEPKRKRRSNAENRYMWGVVIPILAEHFGYTNDEMLEAIKITFLRKHSEGKPDTARGTSELSTIEFEELMSKIRMWAAMEWDLQIPMPNEVDWSENEY